MHGTRVAEDRLRVQREHLADTDRRPGTESRIAVAVFVVSDAERDPEPTNDHGSADDHGALDADSLTCADDVHRQATTH